MTTIHTSQFASAQNNGGFAQHSIHAVASLAPYIRRVIQQAGYTHFIVVNGHVTFLTFGAPAN